MKRKNEKAITLIALIITIIIMLILAGVVISLTIGENGLFNTAKYAAKKWNNEAEKEQKELAKLDSLLYYTSFEDMLEGCEIDTKYTLEDLVNNKDGILEKVLSNDNAVDYILSNSDDYLETFKNSEIAISLLATKENVGNKIVNNSMWLSGIQNSANAEKFNKHMKTIPIMTSNTIPSGEIIAMNGEENNYPHCAFDGNRDTYFYNAYYKDNVKPNFNHEIIYKYDEIKNIYKISVILGNPSGAYTSNQCSIFISKDENGDNWEEVKKDEWINPSAHDYKNKSEEITFEIPKQVRRIKVYSYSESNNAIMIHTIREIQAYGI